MFHLQLLFIFVFTFTLVMLSVKTTCKKQTVLHLSQFSRLSGRLVLQHLHGAVYIQ